MKILNIDFNAILNSIITAASIMIAVIIPFIINSVIDYNSRREKRLSEMKAYYNTLNSFRELIYCIFLIDFWKNNTVIRYYDKAVKKGDKREISALIKDNEFLTLYEAFKFISDKYISDIHNNSKRIFSYNEICAYQKFANKIWYAIECRNDFKNEIDALSFEKLSYHELERIRKVISNISKEYQTDEITIDLIADISGDMEMTVIDSLSDIAFNYEKPLEPIIKKLYGVLLASLIFGVITPLILLLLVPACTYLMVVIVVSILIICFSAIIIITGKYIGFI